MPWKAWYGDELKDFLFPDSWQIKVVTMKECSSSTSYEYEKAFNNPIESRKIQEVAKSKKSVAIAVDDLTRPTSANLVFPRLVKELNKGGIPRDKIWIVVGTGAHRPLIKPDLIKKLGRNITDRFPVYVHHPYENLVDVTVDPEWGLIKVNKYFMQAELRIVVGSITPHLLAGFGGGAKLVFPGLANFEAILSSHSNDSLTCNESQFSTGNVRKNKFRGKIERIARKAALDIGIYVVPGPRREIMKLFVGDPTAAYQMGVDFARNLYSSDRPEIAEIGIFNAYPIDTEFCQANKGFNPLFFLEKQIIRKGGAMILVTAASEGLGFHSLSMPGMRLYKVWTEQEEIRRVINEKRLIIFSPGVTRNEVYQYVDRDTLFFDNWTNLITALESLYVCPKVTVFPYAPLQLLSNN
jgi:nickel-dependent lactate racemase